MKYAITLTKVYNEYFVWHIKNEKCEWFNYIFNNKVMHTWFSFFIELVCANICICEKDHTNEERVSSKYKIKYLL